MSEVDRRLPEGGGEAVQSRIERCRVDLVLLQDLDQIDDFRWTSVDGRFPSENERVVKWAEACRRYGIVPGTTTPEEAAQRVNDSLVRYRLLGVLDLWLLSDPSAGVRAILGVADPDGYREGVRDAIRAGNEAELSQRVGREEALRQPSWFAAVIGQIPSVPVARRREVLEVALSGSAADYTLPMAIGGTYPVSQRQGAVERMRWFQAAVTARPRSAAAHNALGNALWDKGDKDAAVREFQIAIALDLKFSSPHNNLGNALDTKGDPDGAIAEYRKAIELNPQNVVAYTNMGNVLLRAKGDVEGAIRAYQAAIAINRNYTPAHNGLRNALATKGELDGAIKK